MPSGRSWCFRFRDPKTGATGRVKIGNYPDLSLKDARATADDMRKLLGGNLLRVFREVQAASDHNP